MRTRRVLPALAILAALASSGLAAAQDEVVTRTYFADNVLIARGRGESELFRIEHLSVNRLVGRGDSTIILDGKHYYAHSAYLMELDPVREAISRRIAFPAVIERLELTGDAITVTLAGETESHTFRPARPGPRLYPTSEQAVTAPERDAQNVIRIPNFSYFGFGGNYKPETAEDAIRRGTIDEAMRRNPTNPWFPFVKGVILSHLNRNEQARHAFRSIAHVDGAPFYDYLRIATLLANLGHFAESVFCFERGLSEMVKSGYEPELLMSAEAYQLYSGSYAPAVREATGRHDVDRAIELTERVWRLAPRCDGVAYAFAGMAEYLEKMERPQDAAVWYSRARDAVRFSHAVGSRQFVSVGMAGVLALAIVLAILFVRALPSQRRDLADSGGLLSSWRNPGMRFRHAALAYANRREVLGVLLVAAASFASSWYVMQSERSVPRTHSIPEEAKTGTWGHPRTVEQFDKLGRAGSNDAARLLYCIAQQQAGQGDTVREIYRQFSRLQGEIAAIAHNNLGVISGSKGNYDVAFDSFRKALEEERNLVEALYNLDEPVDSPRTSRTRRYAPDHKLIALPSPNLLAAAFASAPVTERASVVKLVGGLDDIGWPNMVTMVLSALVFVLAVPFLFIHRPGVEKKRGPLAGLAYVVPGTSGRLAPLGGLILMVWIYCVIALVLVLQKRFLTTLDTQSSELIRGHFGLAGGVFFSFEQWLAFFGPLGVVVIWLVNMLAMLRASKPRPAGGGMTQAMVAAKKKRTMEMKAAVKPDAAPHSPQGQQAERPAAKPDSHGEKPEAATEPVPEKAPAPDRPPVVKTEAEAEGDAASHPPPSDARPESEPSPDAQPPEKIAEAAHPSVEPVEPTDGEKKDKDEA